MTPGRLTQAFWILVAAVAIAFGIRAEVGVLVWGGYVLLGVLLVCGVLMRLGRPRLRVRRYLSATEIRLGGQTTATTEVSGRTVFPLSYSAQDMLSPQLGLRGERGLVWRSPGQGPWRYHYRLVGRERGYFALGPVRVSWRDYFGVGQRQEETGAVDHLTVYPKVLPVQKIRLLSNRPLGDVRARQQILEDPARMAGVRDYQRGDSLRRIHWKATAHRRRLQSKLYDPFSEVNVNLVLNLNAAEYPLVRAPHFAELAIVCAASLTSRIIDDRQAVGLISNGLDLREADGPAGQVADRVGEDPARRVTRLPVRRGHRHLAGILATLGRLQVRLTFPLWELLVQVHRHLAWTSSLVVITPSVDERAVGALMEYKRRGFVVAVILVGTGEEAREAQIRLAARRIAAHPVSKEDDLAIIGGAWARR